MLELDPSTEQDEHELSEKPQKSDADIRAERLAAQLRANLQRRKAQSRARRDGEADVRPDGIEAAGEAGKND